MLPSADDLDTVCLKAQAPEATKCDHINTVHIHRLGMGWRCECGAPLPDSHRQFPSLNTRNPKA